MAEESTSSLPPAGGHETERRDSSSPDLSSPPDSPAEQLHFDQRSARDASIVVDDGAKAPKVKRARKAAAPKRAAADASNGEPKEKVKRPRKSKDPAAPVVPRKKRKDAAVDEMDSKAVPGNSRQPKITEMNIRPRESSLTAPAEPQLPSQNSKNEDIPKPVKSFFAQPLQPQQHQPNPPPPPPPPQQQQQQQQSQQTQQAPRTSGQNYDPIRSSSYDPVRETVVAHNPFTNGNTAKTASNSPMLNRASASPSIASLIDAPNPGMTSPSLAAQSFAKLQSQEGPTSAPASPMAARLAPSPLLNTIVPVSQASAWSKVERQSEPASTSATPASAAPLPSQPTEPVPLVKKASPMIPAKSTATSSTAASPKSSTVVDIQPPPLPGSVFPRNGPDDGTESRAPTIILHIPLNGETNKYVNFTRLAEESYGWDALHPRLAAQRERLARVAAAGAALEKSGSNKESGDEMSLDMSDGEGDGSNVEMGGMSDGRTGTDNGTKKPVKKKRLTKEDEYDKDDGFVDDSEMLWEEQAAASKDGFFVYSGPLVPEGEKPQLERSEPAKRGRGGGPGSRGGRGSRGGATGSTRGGANSGGGVGSRGGSTTRKPRVTKADRARMELEKAEREKQGMLTAKNPTYNNMVLANPTNLGGTPMVFNQ